MESIRDKQLRQQLIERRQSLEKALSKAEKAEQLIRLLQEVDSALERMDDGTYGLCTVCHEPIEEERLMADPLICICLDHLTSDQQRTLEEDLELASRIQNKLLPKKHLSVNGWEIHYVYKPAGIVSGDYIDLVIPSVEDGTLFMLLGDVSGKGIAASMLMSHLHAIFRSLITTGLPLFQLATQANRIFCESTMATHYATLVFARADREGKLEVCNAGHNPPILMQKDAVTRLKATGTPLGMFCESEYTMKEILLSPGDIALFYTDGLTETRNNANTEYGEDRLARLVADFHALSPRELINVCLEDLDRFQAGLKRTDDLTILGIRRLS